MGAVRMRAVAYITVMQVIHTTPVHQLTSCEVKSCVFMRNKCILKHFLLKTLLSAKSHLSITMHFPVKSHLV